MNARQRVLAALEGGIPDRVPYMELYIDEAVARCALGIPQLDCPSPMSGAAPLSAAYFGGQGYDPIELAKAFSLDALIFAIQPQIYFKTQVRDGQYCVAGGLIQSRQDLARVSLIDPHTAEFEFPARSFIDRVHAHELAAGCFINLGSDPVALSMGWQNLAYALVDDPSLVETLVGIYSGWSASAVRRINSLGFDFIWAGDDIAFRSGPIISPQAFRRFFIPGYRLVAEAIRLPWIFHTDGNFLPVLDDLLRLGMNALHPIEPDALDIRQVHHRLAGQVGLVGNIDINILAAGSPQEVDAIARGLIADLAPGGGYIISSSNSITRACRVENVLAMAHAAKTWGEYPISVSRGEFTGILQ